MQNKVAVAYVDESSRLKAQALALELGLNIDLQAPIRLLYQGEKLVLDMPSFKQLSPDFSHKIVLKNLKAGRNQAIVKACRPGPGVHIMDVTAGWGKDAAILASFGAHVTLIERHPVMAALLQNSLALKDTESNSPLAISLIKADAMHYLSSLEHWPDIIYMDPMHPERIKSALVKKKMQALQQLIGSDEDALALLTQAQQHVIKKVVVKWPSHLPPLKPPNASFKGKTIRYDCFLPTRT